MDIRAYFSSIILVVFLGYFCSVSEALTCYQCNIFVRGSPWPCDSDRGMKEVSGCYACLKTFTRTYLHNTFFDSTYTSFESRVCVKDKDYMKSAGCHPHESASGYMKRCFCYDDLCNSGNKNYSAYGILLFSSLVMFIRNWII